MKIVMTLLVRDEEDIVAQNLDFHLDHGVDFVIATDNLSEDGTREILESYRRQGALHYLFEPQDDYAQSQWVTRMARMAIDDFGADWLIHSDADEFWWTERASGLKEVLRDVPATVLALEVRRHNFVPRPVTGSVSFLESMTYRQRDSVNGLGAPLPPKVCHRALPEFTVAQGNHAVYAGDSVVDAATTDELCIFHYPMRSLSQFSRKIEKGGAAYQRSNLPAEMGSVWRQLFELHQREGLARYFEDQVFHDRRIRECVSDGTLLEDPRLLNHFKRRGLSLDGPQTHEGAAP